MKIRITLSCLLFLFCLSACKEGENADLSFLVDELQSTIEGMKSKVTQTELDTMATDEVEKLFTFEYSVKDIPAPSEASALTETLAQMGQERWNCFHIEEKKEYIRLYCKRRPKTYLRYVPRFF